jgi:hypothetical protein
MALTLRGGMPAFCSATATNDNLGYNYRLDYAFAGRGASGQAFRREAWEREKPLTTGITFKKG